jgi:hypothetical protein
VFGDIHKRIKLPLNNIVRGSRIDNAFPNISGEITPNQEEHVANRPLTHTYLKWDLLCVAINYMELVALNPIKCH